MLDLNAIRVEDCHELIIGEKGMDDVVMDGDGEQAGDLFYG